MNTYKAMYAMLRPHAKQLHHLVNTHGATEDNFQAYMHRLPVHTYASMKCNFGFWWSIQHDIMWSASVEASTGDTIINVLTTLDPDHASFIRQVDLRFNHSIQRAAAQPWEKRLHTIAINREQWSTQTAKWAQGQRFEMVPSTFYQEDHPLLASFSKSWLLPFEKSSDKDTTTWADFMMGSLYPALWSTNNALGAHNVLKEKAKAWSMLTQVSEDYHATLKAVFTDYPAMELHIPFATS